VHAAIKRVPLRERVVPHAAAPPERFAGEALASCERA